MKVLASDFDNTLFVEEELDFSQNVKAIKEFMVMGNLFIIITGRSYKSLKEVINKYKIPYSYLFCEDGAKIYNNMDVCIDEVYIKEEKVEQILNVLENYNVGYILDDGEDETTDLSNVVKINIPYENKTVATKMLRDISQKVDIYGYISKSHINIVDSKINKYLSLKKFIKIEEIKEKDLYVIGDNINDLEMLQNYNGAIMKKHSKELNKVNKKEYETLKEFINDLIKNKFQ